MPTAKVTPAQLADLVKLGARIGPAVALPTGTLAPQAAPEQPQRNKYGVRQDAAGKAERTVDGILFASKRESQRYVELRILEQAGVISDLELQPRYELHVNGVKVGVYRADFRYRCGGQTDVEDVKANVTKTEAYRLRKRMVEAEYGIQIREV